MSYLIFTEQQPAEDLCLRVDKAMGFPKSEFPLYDNPRKHPIREEWEVFIEDYALPFLSGDEKSQLLEFLPSDWHR